MEKIPYNCCPRTGQYDFILNVLELLPFKKESDLWQDFLAFHNRNPHVYDLLKESILASIAEGFVDDSIARHIEYVRKVLRITICSNHRAYYARIFIEEYPQHRDYFKLRPVRV